MVTNMIIFFSSQNMYALLDPGAAHSFISCKFISKLSVLQHKLNKGHSIKMDLLSLEISDFYIILRMHWLTKHCAFMDYFKRKMTFKVLIDKEIEFRGER